jgi:hypothetical protein
LALALGLIVELAGLTTTVASTNIITIQLILRAQTMRFEQQPWLFFSGADQ